MRRRATQHPSELHDSPELLARAEPVPNGALNHPLASSAVEESPWSEREVLLACLLFRFVNALLVQTYFNPDEHWQGTEVAHRIVFGYGHLTWEWSKGIRSYLHPLIFAVLYKLLAMLGLDSPWLLIRSPRLLQSVFAALGDYYLFKLAQRCFGERVARWSVSFIFVIYLVKLSYSMNLDYLKSRLVCLSYLMLQIVFLVDSMFLFELLILPRSLTMIFMQLFCQLTNWFTFFCMVRTLSNCLETVLTTIALFYWHIGKQVSVKSSHCFPTARQLALSLAAIACAIRPTSSIVWLYIGLIHVFETHDKLQFLMIEAFPIGAIVFGATSLVDRWMYGKWTFAPLNFFWFNLFSSGGDFYGTHPWHWYFSQGFPAITLTFLPLTIAGIWWSKEWQLAGLIGWVLMLYSFIGHKEFRFILPVLPLALMFAGYCLATLEPKDTSRFTKSSSDCTAPESKRTKQAVVKWQRKTTWFHFAIIGLLLTNVPTTLYLSLVHQRGSESVMEYLGNEAAQGHVKSVMFLMPCHSTPFYSFVHVNIPMRFLDCSPSDEDGYLDEADHFMSNPERFLFNMFEDSSLLPSHMVLFNSLEDRVKLFLETNKYSLGKRFFHAHFPVDRELQGNVLVYSQQPSIVP